MAWLVPGWAGGGDMVRALTGPYLIGVLAADWRC